MVPQSVDSLAVSLKHNQVVARGAWVAIGGLVAWMLTGHFYTVDAAERTVEKHIEQTAKSVDEIKDQLAVKEEATHKSREEFRQYHDKLSDKIEQLGRDQREILKEQREVLMLLLQLERNGAPQN